MVAGGHLQSRPALIRYNNWIDVARVASGMGAVFLRDLSYFSNLCHLCVVETIKSRRHNVVQIQITLLPARISGIGAPIARTQWHGGIEIKRDDNEKVPLLR